MFTHLFSLVSKHSYAFSDISPVLWLLPLLLLFQVKREDFKSIFSRQYRQISKWVFFLLPSKKQPLTFIWAITPLQDHISICSTMESKTMAPSKDVHVLNPSIYECGTLHGTRNFEDLMKLRIWSWGDWPRLCMWIQYNLRILIKGHEPRSVGSPEKLEKQGNRFSSGFQKNHSPANSF